MHAFPSGARWCFPPEAVGMEGNFGEALGSEGFFAEVLAFEKVVFAESQQFERLFFKACLLLPWLENLFAEAFNRSSS